ncbi:hypothetical protein PAXRUDRAFT_822247 [Paxillus rubicundulus Ve08.2h10]|uniref:Unplaced genomic scaffold scaffold_25, whole genome shotgun sequence n=1 Tax=Paxillus rubicundulus Ve08.2h10 TaxID=930991 RepID=A0A0D0E5G9_9AGAM|nr:hypothetical protein PAXRUDRAFT_822247 [Paxillus rubicundulus Ve08.2h10]
MPAVALWTRNLLILHATHFAFPSLISCSSEPAMPVLVAVRPQIYRRGGSSSLHATNIIVIIIFVIGGFIVLFSLVQFLHRLCRRKSAPLPPKQPIAYYREQYLTEFADRRGNSVNSFEPSNPSVPHRLSPAGSDASHFLVEGEDISSEGASAYFLDSSGSLQTSRRGSPRLYRPHELQTPNPSFGAGNRRNSSSSMGSGCSTPPPPSVHSSSQPQSTFLRPIPSRHRPRSMVSTNSVPSSSNRSTIVGVPHGPHSQVKIVLPAPLAPALRPHVPRSSSDASFPGIDSRSNSVRTSMVDMWAPPLHRSASSDYIGLTGGHSFGRSASRSLSSPRISRLACPTNIDNLPPSSYPLSPFPTAVSEDRVRVDRGRIQSQSSPSTYLPQTLASRARWSTSPLRQSHKLQKSSRQ